ncbi:MAG: CAP domain-containing protein [bacterium]
MPTFLIFMTLHFAMFIAEVSLWRSEMHKVMQQMMPKGEAGVIFNMINEVRKKNSLNELKIDDTLSHLAWAYADDMVRRGYFGHINPEGENIGMRLERARMAYSLAGEILAENRSAEGAIEAWFSSPSHYTAIMQDGYEKMGIGIVEVGGGYSMYVVIFFRPLKWPYFTKTVIFSEEQR